VTEYSAIPGEDTNIFVINLNKAVVEARKGNRLHIMKKIREHISLLQEEAEKVKAHA
jgi:hypothetical protein